MINLLKFVKEREKSTKDTQSVKQKEILWTKSNLVENIMSSPPPLFFLTPVPLVFLILILTKKLFS